MKKPLRIISLIYFIVLAAFWFADNYIELGVINYIAIAVVVIVLLQLFINKSMLGMCIGIGGILFCGYRLVLAVISLLGSTGSNALPFFMVLLSVFSIGVVLAIVLFAGHLRQHNGKHL